MTLIQGHLTKKPESYVNSLLSFKPCFEEEGQEQVWKKEITAEAETSLLIPSSSEEGNFTGNKSSTAYHRE